MRARYGAPSHRLAGKLKTKLKRGQLFTLHVEENTNKFIPRKREINLNLHAKTTIAHT